MRYWRVNWSTAKFGALPPKEQKARAQRAMARWIEARRAEGAYHTSP